MTHDSLDAAFLKTLTILYVEDDPSAREEIGVFLRRRAGKLVVACDGAEGLAAFRKKPTDIVVTDIQMPNLDGLTMAQEIRSLDRDVPILVTTAFEQTDYLMRSLEIGIDQYVLKPIQGQRFEAALMTIAHRLSAEDQLRQKQKLEAEAIRLRHHAALSVLLGGIAHDYNNLLQAIVTAVSLAQVKLDPAAEAYQILEKSERSSDQVRQLGRRLLMLANPSNHHQQVGALNALLRRSVLATLAGSSIRPEFDFRAGEVLVRHNEANLMQAFEALTQNAREALPSGGRFQISTELCDVTEQNDKSLAPGSYLHIRLQDSGMGIPAESLPMIFEPYYSTKERGSKRGTGLGLALCESIIRAHHGAISAESRPSEGATFHLYLPVAEPDSWPRQPA
ncbi:MAG: response regulator [Holophagaceae bacterium]|nr:response regulator [Holophagaceae bacterium]